MNAFERAKIVQIERSRILRQLDQLPGYLAVAQPKDGIPVEKKGPEDQPHVLTCWYMDAVKEIVNPSVGE